MRNLSKVLTLGVIGLGALGLSGAASAQGYDRTSVGLRIGGLSIGFTSGDHDHYYGPRRRVVVEEVPVRVGYWGRDEWRDHDGWRDRHDWHDHDGWRDRHDGHDRDGWRDRH